MPPTDDLIAESERAHLALVAACRAMEAELAAAYRALEIAKGELADARALLRMAAMGTADAGTHAAGN
jgi:hypothetical protein